MNKSTISNYLLIASIIFIGAFFLGRKSKEDKIFMGKDPKEEIYLSRIDSLKSVIQNSESRIDTIIITKTKLKIKYEADTVYINSMGFDSLKFLFSRKYPRHNSNK